MTHNELVRDNIPALIKDEGKEPQTRILNDSEYLHELRRKLLDVTAEAVTSGNVDSLADVVEVVFALADHVGIERKDLEAIRLEKATKFGLFRKRIFLIETTQKEI